MNLFSFEGFPPPDESACGRAADAHEGCRGRPVAPFGACLEHLDDEQFGTYLRSLAPGSSMDHRGTVIGRDRLGTMLERLRPAPGRPPVLGRCRFGWSTFHSADFSDAVFQEGAQFYGASFRTDLAPAEGPWAPHTRFDAAVFRGDIDFDGAAFAGPASFSAASFQGGASFGGASFEHRADFSRAVFARSPVFSGTRFQWALFHGAGFESVSRIGPLSATLLDLSRTKFSAAVTIEAGAGRIDCGRAWWASTASLRVRCAALNLDGAVLEFPVTVSVLDVPDQFRNLVGVPGQPGMVRSKGPMTVSFPGFPFTEEELGDAYVGITSLRGVDAAHLVLSDVDVSQCHFTGTVHLDQIRLEGQCRWARPPSGWHRRGLLPMRWTPRRTLADEHHWRAFRQWDTGGWTPAGSEVEVRDPGALAPVFRALRKAFEDGKDEPGAADFYYGEMEMRRHNRRPGGDREQTPRGERWLLHAYWALSGYGLRAGRAAAWLALAVTATVILMMGWGLARESPDPQTTGWLRDGRIALTTDTPAPANPAKPLSERFTTQRFEKSLRVVLNSVVFRSSGQDLTTFGTYTEMTARIGEPVLLGLVVLAVRSRIKR